MENENIYYVKIADNFCYGMYADLQVIIMISSGYINASKICSYGKKFISNWRQTRHSKKLIDECKKQIPPSATVREPIITITEGNNFFRGTYVHRFLIPHIASWVAVDLSMVISIIVNNYYDQKIKLHNMEMEQETLKHLLEQNEEDVQSLRIQLREMEENETVQEEHIQLFKQQIAQKDNEKQNIILRLQYIQQYATVSLPDTRKQHKFAVMVVNGPKFKYYVIRTQKGKFEVTVKNLKLKYPQLYILLTLDYSPNGFDLYNKMKQTMGQHISFRGNYFNSDYSENELNKQIHTLKNE